VLRLENRPGGDSIMNIFVLNSGRCGSLTFIQACKHIQNFSSGHETRIHKTGIERLAYPERHIEADNRLSWLLGRLDQTYGDHAFYVHLHRERNATASSFERRSGYGIMQAYREGILLGAEPDATAHAIALDYLETVERNILLFLKGKTHVMDFHLERAEEYFPTFWKRIGARGDYAAAVAEWQQRYNKS
jgi:hypothetical protein